MKQLPADLARRILDHSDALLVADHELSINRVAEVTGIPRATLYYYFSGKDHLLSFFVEHVTDHFSEATSKAVARRGTAASRLRAALKAGMQLGHDEPWLGVALVRGLSMGALVTNMRSLYERGFEPVRDLLLEGRETGELAFDDVDLVLQVIVGSMVTYAMLQLDVSGEVPVDGVLAIADTLLNGLQSR